jgi:putative phosphoesterase
MSVTRVSNGTIIGVISDTRGMLRREAAEAFQHAEYILHAGNIGDKRVLEQLKEIAPVRAVRGSLDHYAWALSLPETNVLEVGDVAIFIVHNLAELNTKRKYDVIVSGHGHLARQEKIDGVLYFNPGCAGYQQGHLPVSVGMLTVSHGTVTSEIIELHV